MMYAVCVTFKIRAGKFDSFRALVEAQARASLTQEAGCLHFDVCGGPENEIFLYELYTDAEAFATHLSSAHFRKFDAEVAPMVADKAVRTFDWVVQA